MAVHATESVVSGQSEAQDATQPATVAASQQQSRPCKACEGQPYAPVIDLMVALKASLADEPSPYVCPACSGSGRVVESIPAADALADAETLQRYAWSLLPTVRRRWVDHRLNAGRTYLACPEFLADVTSADASSLAKLVSIWHYTEDEAVAQAGRYARAAFRAVPGLRA